MVSINKTPLSLSLSLSVTGTLLWCSSNANILLETPDCQSEECKNWFNYRMSRMKTEWEIK